MDDTPHSTVGDTRPTVGDTRPTVGDTRPTVGDTRPRPPVASMTHIEPWVDPIVDERGHDPRGVYVERYWLSVVGPTALWIVRRFADLFDEHPHGFEVDLAHMATTMGLSFDKGATSPFGRALHRCVMFGLAQPIADGLAVRRRLPSVARRHLTRLPEDVRAAHDDWARRTVQIDHAEIEQRLRELGVSPAAAARACEAAALAS